MNTDELWKEVYSQLKHHQKPGIDRTPLQALNRVLKKVQFSDTPVVDPEKAKISLRNLSRDEVASLRPHHKRSLPVRIRWPIVIVRYREESYIVDGNTRVNWWLASSDTDYMDAIEITIEC